MMGKLSGEKSESFVIGISPFRCEQAGLTARAVHTNSVADGCHLLRPQTWLDGARELVFTKSGRAAIRLCLLRSGLSGEDEVWIETTTGGPYVSGCVTGAIESVCKWSRKLTSKTKMILVIHEFGFPCSEEKMTRLTGLGIPLLEDCAYGVGSRLAGGKLGVWGDSAIYSLSKHYPLPHGGFLVSRAAHRERTPDLDALSADPRPAEVMLRMPMDKQLAWNQQRRANWKFFAEVLSGLGVTPYFDLEGTVAPGVFVCRLPDSINAAALKADFQAAGIEATEYYGHGGFYFPVHQFLNGSEKKLLVSLFRRNG